jgi:hypothetical protein
MTPVSSLALLAAPQMDLRYIRIVSGRSMGRIGSELGQRVSCVGRNALSTWVLRLEEMGLGCELCVRVLRTPGLLDGRSLLRSAMLGGWESASMDVVRSRHERPSLIAIYQTPAYFVQCAEARLTGPVACLRRHVFPPTAAMQW